MGQEHIVLRCPIDGDEEGCVVKVTLERVDDARTVEKVVELMLDLADDYRCRPGDVLSLTAHGELVEDEMRKRRALRG